MHIIEAWDSAFKNELDSPGKATRHMIHTMF